MLYAQFERLGLKAPPPSPPLLLVSRTPSSGRAGGNRDESLLHQTQGDSGGVEGRGKSQGVESARQLVLFGGTLFVQ